MRALFYCGVNKNSKGNLPFYLPAIECKTRGTIDVDPDQWKRGAVSHVCPTCGHRMEQDQNHFERAWKA